MKRLNDMNEKVVDEKIDQEVKGNWYNKRNAFVPDLIDIICPETPLYDLVFPPSISSTRVNGIKSKETYVDTNSDYKAGEFELKICESMVESDSSELNLN